MISNKVEALKYISQIIGEKKFNKVELEACIDVLQKVSSSDGLSESEIDQIVEFLCNTILASSVYINLFKCLVPKTTISKKSLGLILEWLFTEIGKGKITNNVEKKCIQWLTGTVHYELGDITVIDSYYHSFLFLLDRPHVERCVCGLLCLISKPEDAKRWVVQQVLKVQKVNGPRAHLNSLLSLLKSYRPDVVPEMIPVSVFDYGNSGFNECLKRAYSRNMKNATVNDGTAKGNGLQWNTLRIYDERNKMLPRLIPVAESMHLESTVKNRGKKLQSIMEIKSMEDLGMRLLKIEIPAQTLSLLANVAGYHVLAFSNIVTKARFSHKLYHTLCRVFLLELDSYSEKEKINFLASIKGFQEYTHQSIPVVTTFLFNYLLVWDGESYREQILGLLEWIEVRNEEDLEKYIFRPLRQIFRSSGIYCKYLIIETMGKLVRNLLVMDKREGNFFRNDYQECDLTNSIKSISTFVGGLIINGIIWSNEKTTRNILRAALDFYDTTQAVEQAGDLPIMIVMPYTLVYKCLFSGSRVCLARLCSLLNKLQVHSVERLYLLGVFEDFANEVKQLNIYMLDYYRCLWSSISFRKDQDSFIFHDNLFCEIFWKFKNYYGGVIDKVFGVDYNSSLWDPQTKGLRENVVRQLAEDYPSIIQLKQLVEDRLLAVCS